MPNTISIQITHKIIPDVISSQVGKALRYYPKLKDVPIEFKFKKNIKKSTMQAQPKLNSFFKRPKNREYIILISEKFPIGKELFNILDVEEDVLVGWFGHELGHVIDYKNRSSFGMLIFGFKYLFSKRYLREVERTADTIAVQHGMGDFILRTKNFILHHTAISLLYKERIKQLYLSPEEIMEMVNTMDDKAVEEKVEKELKEKS